MRNFFLPCFLLPVFFLSGCTHDETARPAAPACGAIQGSSLWKYCISPGDPQNKNVIYYFHGAGGNEFSWADPTKDMAVVREKWMKTDQPQPTVVAVSLGMRWKFSDMKPAGKDLSTHDDFIKIVMPEIENRFLKFTPAVRTALGTSMGGFNAAAIALRHPDLFSKAALMCPSVLRENFFSDKDLKKYVKSTGAVQKNAQEVQRVVRLNFGDTETYRRMSPLALLKALPESSPLKIFISVGKQDDFGFFTESENFVKLAQQKKLQVTWRPVEGKHCSSDLDGLAQFLLIP